MDQNSASWNRIGVFLTQTERLRSTQPGWALMTTDERISAGRDGSAISTAAVTTASKVFFRIVVLLVSDPRS